MRCESISEKIKGQSIKYPPVLVIILNYCGRSKLGQCLDDCINSVLNSNYPNFSVLFVDNNSNDGSVEYVEKRFGGNEKFSLRTLNANYGYAGGNNIAVRLSFSDAVYIAFVNPDVVVTPDWLTPLVETMERDPTVGVVQPKLLLLKEPTKINSVGMWLTRFGLTEGPKGPGTGFMELDTNQYNSFMEIFSVTGATFLIRKTLFNEVRGFDSDYFMYGEEIDLCWRVWLHGFRVLYNPFSKVFHLEGGVAGSINKPTPLRLYFGDRNRLLNLIKNYEYSNSIKYLSISIPYLLVFKFVASIKNKNILPLRLYIRALVDITVNFPKTHRKRLFVNYVRQVSDKDLFFKGLIR